jgi:hypothetical protein
LTFFGTFESRTEVGAVIQTPSNDKITIVRYGTLVDGWRVVDISHHRLVLATQDRQAVFMLFDPAGSSKGEGPAAGPPPAGPQFHPPPSITPVPVPVPGQRAR